MAERLCLVLGGVRSGKSAFAEELAGAVGFAPTVGFATSGEQGRYGNGASGAGALGVVIGIEQACEALDWGVTIFDVSRSNLSTSQEGFVEGYQKAFDLHPDGLVLVSGNIEQPYHAENLARAEQLQIPVVGWHVAPAPGLLPDTPVRINVTTPSNAVAEAAAALVVPTPEEPDAGVVIFTDTSIDFARDKSDQMLAVLDGCDRCTVLSVRGHSPMADHS